MNILIVEDDFINRAVIVRQFTDYGTPDVAVNGVEAVEAVRLRLSQNNPYSLICLDIMMPEMNGQDALREIRKLEESFGVTGLRRSKIIMTTALSSSDDILASFRDECDGYLVKPIKLSDIRKLMDVLKLKPGDSNTAG